MRHNTKSDDEAHLQGDGGGGEDRCSIEGAVHDEESGADLSSLSTGAAFFAVRRGVRGCLSYIEDEETAEGRNGKDQRFCRA